jgi:hypothetical protein
VGVVVAYKKQAPLDQDGQPIPAIHDPADFLVAPCDTRGVSYRLTFRVAPDMEKALDQIVASNRFPFSTRGDILRWCLREGVRSLDQMEPVTSVTKRVDLLSTILGEENSHAEFMHIFDQLGESVDRYLADQAADQAIRVVAIAKHQFEMMPEGHWRDRYLRELKKRFGHLMVGTSGASVKKHSNGEG